MIPFANPSDPSALNPVFGWQPGGAVGNAYDLTLYPGELSLIADAESSGKYPALIYPFQGNFQVSVRLDFQTDGPYIQAAGIGFRASGGGGGAFIQSLFGGDGLEILSGAADQTFSDPYANSVVYLRITKRGTLFSTEYSANGTNWVTLVNNSVISLPDNVEVYLYAFSDNDEGVVARFSEFNIVER